MAPHTLKARHTNNKNRLTTLASILIHNMNDVLVHLNIDLDNVYIYILVVIKCDYIYAITHLIKCD